MFYTLILKCPVHAYYDLIWLHLYMKGQSPLSVPAYSKSHKQALQLADLSKAIFRHAGKILSNAFQEKERTKRVYFVCLKTHVCVCVSTAVHPGPVVAEAPSNRRNCCTRDRPKQWRCCPQQRAQGRNVPPVH